MSHREISKPIKVIETFRNIGSWELNNLCQDEPSCFNGYVRIKRYRLTVEEISEPQEILFERLEKLWVGSDNYHDRTPLLSAAKEIGYSFKGRFGEGRA